MDLSECKPMDAVIWHRVKNGKGYTAERVPAEVFYRTKHKVAIKVVTAKGEHLVKYVDPVQLERRTE